MVFNMITGYDPGLLVISGRFDGLDRAQPLRIPITVSPLVIAFKTICGAGSELALYYRTKRSGEFTMLTAGESPASMRLYSEHDTALIGTLTGADVSNTVCAEYYILGVRKE